MNDEKPYPIGIPGVQWGEDEKSEWFAKQSVKRSYSEEVLDKLTGLDAEFNLSQYGALSLNSERYPLFVACSKKWHADRAALLVTGGVHGYETSGVQGAIRFLATHASKYAEHYNVVVAPCVSPWGYETINRWNPIALDPNRSFHANSLSEEAASLMNFVASVDSEILIHIDLHETTDTDNSEFRPALAARDAKHQSVWDIPDGFYTVGNSAKPEAGFQQAIIQSVAGVTHIAPPDANGTIIGVTPEQSGVINYDAGPLGLCMGMTDAVYVTTTEVYPDSPKVNDENCIEAQVAAICGGVDYVMLKR